MVIKSVYINNFTVFEDINIEFCNGINVILGGNGTGKTHLLKFIYAMYETAHEKFLRNGSDIVNKDNQSIIREHAVIEFINNCFLPYKLKELLRVDYPTNLPRITAINEDNILIHDIFTKLGTIDLTLIDNTHSELSTKKIESGYEFGLRIDGYHINNSVFIPAKEMLSHASLYNMKELYGDEMPFDSTHLKIIEFARRMKLKETPNLAKNIVFKLEKIMNGTIREHNGSFWKRTPEGHLIPFSNESDGLKKIGLLWRLIMNGSITNNTVLFWDEPENSINPENIPTLIKILLELQRHGVQIFLTTHNYYIMNYFNVCRETSDDLKFICLKKIDNKTVFEDSNRYDTLSSNPIIEAAILMYEDEITKGLTNEN